MPPGCLSTGAEMVDVGGCASRQAQRVGLTLGELAELYLAEIEQKKKPETIALYRHYLCDLVEQSLRASKAHAISRDDLARLHRKLGSKTKVTANRVLVALSGVYSFANRRGHLPSGMKELNPARGSRNSRSSRASVTFLSTNSLGSARRCDSGKQKASLGLNPGGGLPRGTTGSLRARYRYSLRMSSRRGGLIQCGGYRYSSPTETARVHRGSRRGIQREDQRLPKIGHGAMRSIGCCWRRSEGVT
jgi:hypothetical protein